MSRGYLLPLTKFHYLYSVRASTVSYLWNVKYVVSVIRLTLRVEMIGILFARGGRLETCYIISQFAILLFLKVAFLDIGNKY